MACGRANRGFSDGEDRIHLMAVGGSSRVYA